LDNRGTAQPEVITAFGEAFTGEKAGQWIAFQKRLGQKHVPTEFDEIVTGIRAFLLPLLTALNGGKLFNSRWSPADGWFM
jgi:hypothetical protein